MRHLQRLIGIMYIYVFHLKIYISWDAERWIRQKLRRIDTGKWVEGIISQHHQFHLHIHLSEIREDLQAAMNSSPLSPAHLMRGQKAGLLLSQPSMKHHEKVMQHSLSSSRGMKKKNKIKFRELCL